MKLYLGKSMLIAYFLTGVMSSSYGQFNIVKYEVGASAVSFIYQGDLTPARLGAVKTPGFGGSIVGSKMMSPYFSIRARFAAGYIRGDDSKYEYPAYRKQRNFKFSSPLYELSGQLVWDMLGKNYMTEKRGLSPYLFGGAGITFLNVKRDWSNLNRSYFPESSMLSGLAADSLHATPRAIPVIPVGGGLRYSITPHFDVDLEATYRFVFTDYLDGFSQSAGPLKKDAYYSISIGLIYRIFRFGKLYYLKCPKDPR